MDYTKPLCTFPPGTIVTTPAGAFKLRHPTAADPCVNEEHAWLVERMGRPQPEWLRVDQTGMLAWTTDPNAAIRLVRREDADQLAGMFDFPEDVRATEHLGKRGSRPEVDDRATAPEVFDPLHKRFRFTLDAAALPHNAKLERYFTPRDRCTICISPGWMSEGAELVPCTFCDGLEQPWTGERVWCNPPYSNIAPWVAKGATSDAELVVMLLPANRTEQRWWQEHIEPRRDRHNGPRVEFLPGRMRFIAHDANGIRPNERPPFGVCLVIWGRE